jgi:hypothetical protein
MILNSVNKQNLNGKWLLKDVDSGNGQKGYPGFQLLEIKDSSAEFYTNFSLESQTPTLQVSEEKILTNKNGKFAEYKIVDENHLKLFVNGKSNDKKAIFECDFYRLVPTITTLNKGEIKKLTFILTKNEKVKTKFSFNKELITEEILNTLKKKEGQKMQIEQIDSTFFVSNYFYGKRETSFPIMEVTNDFLKLYPVPTKTDQLIAYRKE